jgi:hypothetical protein
MAGEAWNPTVRRGFSVDFDFSCVSLSPHPVSNTRPAAILRMGRRVRVPYMAKRINGAHFIGVRIRNYLKPATKTRKAFPELSKQECFGGGKAEQSSVSGGW